MTQAAADSYLGYVLTASGTIITALSGTIVFLFKKSVADSDKAMQAMVHRHDSEIAELRTENKSLQIEADECRADREDLRVTVGQLSTRLDLMEEARAA